MKRTYYPLYTICAFGGFVPPAQDSIPENPIEDRTPVTVTHATYWKSDRCGSAECDFQVFA